ncbi:MAG: ECF transporter S component [Clostridia bacterium]|nr:ECF transporter S component [Clostridia bacterium]
MKRISTFKTIITALFAALICVATMLVQIPIPATGGYANLGDGIILICAFLMHPLYAIIAAGLGSALADILAGYISFAPGTLVIKAGVALIAALVFNRFGKDSVPKKTFATMIAAGILAEAFMVLGYFFYEAVLMGVGIGAAGGIIGNIGQGVVGVIVAVVVAPVLRRSSEVRELMERTRK